MMIKNYAVIISKARSKTLIILCLNFLFSIAFSQKQSAPVFINKQDIFGTRCFVENKGQFDEVLSNGEKVLFAYEDGQEKIYFTSQGPVYKFIKQEELKESQREAIEHGKTVNLKTEIFYVPVKWMNSNQGITLQGSDEQNYYLTYGEAQFNSRPYKKLLYKNVYNNIDIEYSIPSEKGVGIKYSVLVHPGANVNDIRIAYQGDATKIKSSNSGEILIKTQSNDITEHAPESFQNGEKIVSLFVLKNDEITFSFPQGYDQNKELIIDPWVTSITGLTTNNYAYDVDYDYQGNTYIYGGYNPFKVSQYNSGGILMWTFAGLVTSQAWSTAPILSQASNFAVNKYNGKTYIGQGYVGSGNRVIRLDALGNYDNFINAANSQFQEVWDLGFHCTSGEVFVLGGGVSSNVSAVTINPTTAVISLSTFQPTNSAIAQDVVSHAIDDAGNIFVIYAGGSLTDKMCLVNPGFNNNIWTQPSTFTAFTEQGNKNQYQWGGSLSSNGFNALAVNNNYLYYYDGSRLAAYNKLNGTIVASTTVPGLTIKRQGGIAVDDCDNLYLGGDGSILCYNFTGTAFNPQTPIPLTVTTPTTAVYDLKLDKVNKILYASGSGFVGVYSPVNTLPCPTATSACFSFVPQDFFICAGTSVTITSANTASLSNVSYSMNPGGLTSTTGSYVVTPTVSTNYTTFVTGTNVANIVVTNSAVNHVTVFPQPSAAPTITQTSCTSTLNAFNLNLSFYPPGSTPSYSIAWSPIPNNVTSNIQTTASAINPGTYNATITAGSGCKFVTSIIIDPLPEPGTFTRQPGGNYVVDCNQPSVTVNLIPASYNYTCSNNITAPIIGPSPVFSGTNAAGTWTAFSMNPTSGCVSTQTFLVTQNISSPSATITPLFQNITCSVSSVITVTAYANPTVNITHQWMAPQGGTLTANNPVAIFSPGGPGTYTHCIVNNMNGCSTCRTFSVTSNDGFPTYSVTSPQNFTLGCSTRSTAVINIVNAQTTPTAGGAVSYTLLGPASSTNYIPNPASVFTVSTPGTWTVVTRDNTNFCETKIQLSVIQNTFQPDISAIVPQQMLNCFTPSIILTGVTTVTNPSYLWSFAATPGNLPGSTITVNANFAARTSTLAGNFTLSITDNINSCISTSVITIGQNLFIPNAAISGGNEISCKTETVSLTNQSSTKIPPELNPDKPVVGYLWMGPSPQEPLQLSTTYIASQPGTYSLTVMDMNNGCIATGTKVLQDMRDYPSIPIPANKPAILDCANGTTTLTPLISIPGNFVYSWTAPVGATISDPTKIPLKTDATGQYWIAITNTTNGCATAGFIDVVFDTLVASFIPNAKSGFAPLAVTFSNTSHSSTNNDNIKSIWSFGNGSTLTTLSASVTPSTVYKNAGRYSVIMYATKGTCLDSAIRFIDVELGSALEIPNVFTPDNDGINDVFFLKTASLGEVFIAIYDRWGHEVYNVRSSSGNISWDGKNQAGHEVAAGVYFYLLQAEGKDGVTYDRNGNITLIR